MQTHQVLDGDQIVAVCRESDYRQIAKRLRAERPGSEIRVVKIPPCPICQSTYYTSVIGGSRRCSHCGETYRHD